MTDAATTRVERRQRRRSAELDRPFFPEGSLIREVQRERAVAMSGARALFMQAAHPVAFVGFFSHTASAEDPHPRLARTALAINTVIYGTERQAAEVQEIVGSMHARVRGRLPEAVGPFKAGTEYRGDDPELLLWILAAFIDSSYWAFERFVRPLSPAEREALWQQWRRVGWIFGLDTGDMPSRYDIHRIYMDAMLESGQLVVTDASRTLARRVILNPPTPAYLEPVKQLVSQFTIDGLPGDLRKQFGFRPVPFRGLTLFATATWLRFVALPLLPPAAREVPGFVMPGPDRSYADLIEAVQGFGRRAA